MTVRPVISDYEGNNPRRPPDSSNVEVYTQIKRRPLFRHKNKTTQLYQDKIILNDRWCTKRLSFKWKYGVSGVSYPPNLGTGFQSIPCTLTTLHRSLFTFRMTISSAILNHLSSLSVPSRGVESYLLHRSSRQWKKFCVCVDSEFDVRFPRQGSSVISYSGV